jgi:plasmid stabilization system protein ParE
MIPRYTRRAARDLDRILSYIAKRSPGGAGQVASSLENSIRFLADNPHGGLKTSDPALLVKILPDYPYKIFYRPRGDFIEIVHIRHAARRPYV